MEEREILHCDCNSFFASVECLYHPEYRDVPMAVAGDAKSRHGIILAKNDKAKAFGITTAETIWQARKKCPNLLLVPPRHNEYHKYYKLLNSIYCSYTDLVEPFGVDESWLDVTASRKLFGSGEQIAQQIRRRVREESGLTVSIGVSFNKVFAKLGSDYKKPDAVTVISRENFRKIVWALPAEDLIFIGHHSGEELSRMGIDTLGQLAMADRAMLIERFGKGGAVMHDYANGIDNSPVQPFGSEHQAKSMGNGTTLARDLLTNEEIKSCVTALGDLVARRLRADGMLAEIVQITLKTPQFRAICRQKPLASPSAIAAELIQAAMELVVENHRDGAPIRAVTLTAQGLIRSDEQQQLSLMSQADYRREKLRELEEAKDKIRNRFGPKCIKYANTLTPTESEYEE